ncbi:MAG: type II secretion system F family protein [Clostridia bacterium]
MQTFLYKALNKEGKAINGRMVAGDKEELRQMIAKKDLIYVSANAAIRIKKDGTKQIDTGNLITLCRQLSSILKAGMPLVKALEMLHAKLDKPKLKKVLEGLYEGVQKGQSLSETMNLMGKTFPVMMVSMVKAGELSGEIDKTLENMAEHYEKEAKTQKEIKSAMTYPIILLVLSVVIVLAMTLFIIPNMMKSMEGKKLPTISRLLMGFSNILKSRWYVIIAVIVGVVFGSKALLRVPKVRLAKDKLMLKLPKVGALVGMVYTGRFARTLATLYQNGVGFVDAMEMCCNIIQNTFVQSELEEAVLKLKRGEAISNALADVTSFNPLLISMLFVGEESGALDTVLTQTADYFDGESSAAIKGITGFIQPVMLCFVAVVVVIVMLGVLQPMMMMYDI